MESRLASLPARPPTPPRESGSRTHSDAGLLVSSTSRSRNGLDTPATSPASADGLPKTLVTASKKVDFLADTHTINGALRNLIRSSEASNPPKSILKSSSNPPSSDPIAPATPEPRPFSTMLEGILVSLNSSSSGTRLDAYISLNGCLKTYSDLPSQDELVKHLPTLLGLIRRDLSGDSQEEAYRKQQFITEAVKLASTLMYQHAVSRAMPDDFRIFLLSKATGCIADQEPSKAIANQYMQVLGILDFKPRVVSNGRVDRLLSALKDVHNRISGRRAIYLRLHIYDRLVRQGVSSMQNRVEDWLGHLFAGLQSDEEQTRGRAISLGMAAGTVYGSPRSFAKELSKLFDSAREDKKDALGNSAMERDAAGKQKLDKGSTADKRSTVGEQVVPDGELAKNERGAADENEATDKENATASSDDAKVKKPGVTYASVFARRLSSWLRSEERAVQVPVIWVIPMLFLRSQSAKLANWKSLGIWMPVMSKCFNSPNAQVRAAANREWSRLVFCMQDGLRSDDRILKFLRNPILMQLKKCVQNRSSVASVLPPYWSLVYHAFAPGQTHEAIDRAWRECVACWIASPLESSFLDFDSILFLLGSLLGDEPRPVWNQSLGNERLIKPQDLPRVDAKWVRSRSADITRVLESALLSDAWTTLQSGDDKVMKVWKSFCLTIRDAAAREVKVSTDTMRAIIAMTGLLKKAMQRSFNSDWSADHNDGIENFALLYGEAAGTIGFLPFAEKRLLEDSADALEVVDSPSKTHGSKKPVLSSAFYLIKFLVKHADVTANSETCERALAQMCRTMLISCTSRMSKLEALQTLIPLTIPDGNARRSPETVLWKLIANLSATCIGSPLERDVFGDVTEPPGPFLEEIVKILAMEVPSLNAETAISWQALLDAIVSESANVAGVAGFSALAEPLMIAFRSIPRDKMEPATIDCFISCIRCLQWNQTQRDTNRVSMILWGRGGSKSAGRVLSTSTWAEIAQVSEVLYRTADMSSSLAPLQFFECLSKIMPPFLSSGGSSQNITLCSLLATSCPVLSIWFSDPDGRLSTTDPNAIAIFSAVVEFWYSLADKIQTLQGFGQAELNDLEGVLDSGLKSRHEIILNRAVPLWNETFGRNQDLSYPKGIRKTLFRLSFVADISFAGIQTSQDDLQSVPISFEFADTPKTRSDMHKLQAFSGLEAPALKHFSNQAPSSEMVVPSSPPSEDPRARPLRKNDSEKSVPQPPPIKGTWSHYNDSQIHFTHVDHSRPSSPLDDSQLLTAHQKEIRERQHQDAPVVDDVRTSDSKPKPLHENDRCSDDMTSVAQSEGSVPNLVDALAAASPAIDLPLLSSSPTPREPRPSRKMLSQPAVQVTASAHLEEMNLSMDEIPSSPPIPLPRKNSQRKRPTTGRPSGVTKSSSLKSLSVLQRQPSDISNLFPPSDLQDKEIGHKDTAQADEAENNEVGILPDLIRPNMVQPRQPANCDSTDLNHHHNPFDDSQRMKLRNKKRCSTLSPKKVVPRANQPMKRTDHTGETDSLSELEDPVSSQIALEMQAASLRELTSQEAEAEDLTQEDSKQQEAAVEGHGKHQKQRGRKRKRTRTPRSSQLTTPAEPEVLDCIVVSSSPNTVQATTVPGGRGNGQVELLSVEIKDDKRNDAASMVATLEASASEAPAPEGEEIESIEEDEVERSTKKIRGSRRSSSGASISSSQEQRAVHEALEDLGLLQVEPSDSVMVEVVECSAAPDEQPARSQNVAPSQHAGLVQQETLPATRTDGIVPKMQDLLAEARIGMLPEQRKAMLKLSAELLLVLAED